MSLPPSFPLWLHSLVLLHICIYIFFTLYRFHAVLSLWLYLSFLWDQVDPFRLTNTVNIHRACMYITVLPKLLDGRLNAHFWRNSAANPFRCSDIQKTFQIYSFPFKLKRVYSDLQANVSLAATAQQIPPFPRMPRSSPGLVFWLVSRGALLSRTSPGQPGRTRPAWLHVQVPARVSAAGPPSSVCPLCVPSTPVMSERHNCIRGREERQVNGQRGFWCFLRRFCCQNICVLLLLRHFFDGC